MPLHAGVGIRDAGEEQNAFRLFCGAIEIFMHGDAEGHDPRFC